uniref:Efflux RND transporter periplasmic adaptor subunit n=1 Tax=Desulfacinum infernum TaxID=35837 RepID=A0A832EKA6_9BACT
MNPRSNPSMVMKNDRSAAMSLRGFRSGVFIKSAVFFGLAALGVLAGALPLLLRSTPLSAQNPESPVPTVAVVTPKPARPVSPLLSADVKPVQEAPIYARANGYLKRRYVDMGDAVCEGQLLGEIDAPELLQELQRARAQLAQAEAALELARVTAQRWAELVKSASVSEQENTEKQADYRLKKANAAAARAEVQRLEQMVSYTRITAPFTGMITSRSVDVVDLVVAGAAKALFRLAQTSRLAVFVQVPQHMARDIQVGQEAEMTVPELLGWTFHPRVTRTAGVIAADSRTFLVELELDNLNGEVLAGSYAQVRFKESGATAALTLPSRAVLFRPEGARVAVVRDQGVVELRAVTLGRDFGQTIEILSGLNATDRVIASPFESVAAGATVLATMAESEERSQ